MSTTTPATARFPLLRGEVAGARRAYPLTPGRNRIGRAPDNDVVLPLPGVSKHHAVLSVSEQGMEVEDLLSKNGTFVNGERVDAAPLAPGDALRLGPVCLALAEVGEDEGDVIALGAPRSGPGAAARPPESTRPAAPRSPGSGGELLALAAELVAQWASQPPRLQAPALATLAAGVGADGAALLAQGPGGVTLVPAAHGAPPRELQRAFAEAIGEPMSGEPTVLEQRLEDGRFATLALVARDEGRAAIALWAATRPHPESATLLRLLAHLLRPLPDRAIPAAGRAESAAGELPRERLTFPPDYVPGASPVMAELYQRLRSVAGSELPILLLGETGVGKEALARTVHLSSRRAAGPFVAINCAAIPAELLEAELFGIRQGVATGVSARSGRLVEASGGTLFLDEIGEMPPALQSKLLRALEQKEAQPVGGAPVAVDVRVAAATNADLGEKLEQGRFRPDLYYRLAGSVLTIPPLRHRRRDIPALVEHFLVTVCAEAGISLRGITAGALEALVERPWPGNVRQLANELRQLVYLCRDSELITRERLGSGGEDPTAPQAAPLGEDLDLGRLEQRAIEEALRRTEGHLTRAAGLLGISRHALRRRLERLEIDRGANGD